jgi:hypothetical protein
MGGNNGTVLATVGAELIRPYAGRPSDHGGSGWEILLVLAVLAAMIGLVFLTRFVIRARKTRRVLGALTAQLQLEAGRALRDPVLVYQARRSILQARGNGSN